MDEYKNLNYVPTSLFSYLSDDLKLDIFDLIGSCCDQGNTRLVCREWSRLMRPRMWRSFRTGLRGSFATNPNSLTREQYACFHDIRILTVDWGHPGPYYSTRFSNLMHYLRNDQLLDFTSTKDVSLDIVQLLGLLRYQSRLRSLRARVSFSTIAVEGQTSWTKRISLLASNLHSLRSLRVYIGDSSSECDYSRGLQDHENAFSSLLIKAMPLLTGLEICGWRQIWSDRDKRIPLTALFGDHLNLNQAPTTLTRLVLANIDLSGAEKIVSTAFNTAALLSLKLERCVNFSLFLQKIATIFRQTMAQLKKLSVRRDEEESAADNDGTHDGLKDLLCSFKGLEELELDFVGSFLMDWKAALRTHGTLKKLLVSTPSMRTSNLMPRPEKIRLILDQCPNLQAFAYTPIPTYFGHTIDCPLQCSLPSTIYLTLDEVATALTIHTLRLLYSPGFNTDEAHRRGHRTWIEKYGRIAHRLATLILTYLYSKGSGITFLALSPVSQWRPACGDRNLHYYPHYFYGLQIVDTHGQRIVTAVPLRDYKAEYLEATSVF